MATDIERLVLRIEANSKRLEGQLARASGQTNKHLGRIERRSRQMQSRVSAAFAGAISGAAIAAVGANMFRLAGDFEASMNRVQGALQISDEAMLGLSGKARELGKTTAFSASQAADAIETLAKNGLSAEQILGGAVDASLRLASALGAQLAPSADLITDLMAQFKLEASQLSSISDKLTGAAINSKFAFDDLRLAVGQAGGVAGGAGVKIEDFVTAIAAIAPNFASGSDAGTSFKSFLQRLTPEGDKARAAMERLGLEFFDAEGNMKSMANIAQELQDSLRGLSDEAKNEALKSIFGSDAIRAAIGLAEVGAAGFRQLSDAIGAVSAQEQAEIRLRGLNGALRELNSAWEELLLTFANSGALEGATGAVTRLTDAIRYLAENFQEIYPYIENMATALTVFLVGKGLAAGIAKTYAFGAALIATARGVATATTAVGGLRLALGALGGPLGFLLTLAGTVFFNFIGGANDAAASIDNISTAANTLERAMVGLRTTEGKLREEQNKLTEASAQYKRALQEEGTQAQNTAAIEVQAIGTRIAKLKELREIQLSDARLRAREAQREAVEFGRELKAQAYEEVGRGLTDEERVFAFDIRNRKDVDPETYRNAELAALESRKSRELAVEEAYAAKVQELRDRLARGDELTDQEAQALKLANAYKQTQLRVDALTQSLEEFEVAKDQPTPPKLVLTEGVVEADTPKTKPTVEVKAVVTEVKVDDSAARDAEAERKRQADEQARIAERNSRALTARQRAAEDLKAVEDELGFSAERSLRTAEDRLSAEQERLAVARAYADALEDSGGDSTYAKNVADTLELTQQRTVAEKALSDQVSELARKEREAISAAEDKAEAEKRLASEQLQQQEDRAEAERRLADEKRKQQEDARAALEESQAQVEADIAIEERRLAALSQGVEAQAKLERALREEAIAREILNTAKRDGLALTDGEVRAIEQLAEKYEDTRERINKATEARDAEKEATDLQSKANAELASSMVGLVSQTGSLTDKLKGLGLQILEVLATGFFNQAFGVSSPAGTGGIVGGLGASLAKGLGFARGVVDLAGPGTSTSDSISARLSRGESVITAEGTRNNANLLRQINSSGRAVQPMRVSGGGDMAFQQTLNFDAGVTEAGVRAEAKRAADMARDQAVAAVSDMAKRSSGYRGAFR